MKVATTQPDVAQMSDRDMVDELAKLFDVEALPDDAGEDQPAMEAESTVTSGDEEVSEEVEAADDTDVEESEDLEAEEADDATDNDKWMPNSLEELAEALEATPDQVLDRLKVRIKADGVESEATLKDVVASHQKTVTLDQRFRAFAEERKNFEAQSSEQLRQLTDKLTEADNTVNALEQLLFQDFNAVNWTELRNDDPTEYMMKQQEMRDRYSSLQNIKTRLEASRKAELEKQHQQQSVNFNRYVQDQITRAKDMVPEWSDMKKMAEDVKSIQDYLRANYEASDAEINTLYDHRMYLLARKAMAYDAIQQNADPKLKQMKTKPKFVKPGARKDPVKTSTKRKQAAFETALEKQTDDAWTEALLQRLS